MCKVASSSSQDISWKPSIEAGCLTLSERTTQRMSGPSLTHIILQRELQPHWVKALLQGSRPRWIQTKSVLAWTITLEAAFLAQIAFLEAAQDLEGTLVKERPHIRTQGTH